MNKKSNYSNINKISMKYLFPLKRLLETDEYATLEDIEESKLDGENLTSRDSYYLQTHHKSMIDKKKKETHHVVNSSEMAQCLISIFDDAIDQIHIISGGKKSVNAIEEFNKTLEERVASSFLYDPIFDNITGDPYPIHFTKEKVRKVLTDSSKVNEFLVLMRNELKEEKTLNSMRKITNNVIHRRHEEQHLLHNENKNFKKLRNFKQLLAHQKRETERQLDEIRNNLYKEKDKTEVLLFENLLREKYVKYWEQARREQNDIRCIRAENNLLNGVAKCDHEITKESRVFTEEECFLLEEERDFQYNIKYWSDKTAEESEQRSIQNQILKEKREDIQKNYAELKILYESHEKEIASYLKMRERRTREFELKEKRRRAAIKIQSWWRGVMVIRKLGPYNPRKRRRGKKGRKGRKGEKKKK